ncbi:MAG: GNAT family N-acetyltransferase [Candidatus Polarisedimenticolaceae bacterium]|nr:GNAT family N-acetyltransferase [Candidatus Polarisedimenticolaceae bacterium]
MHVTILTALSQVPREEWNALVPEEHPFLKYEFLSALESHGCVGERFGWLPQHIVLYDSVGRLVGAMPLYLKFNSYGEFVFDMSWAQAYDRANLDYYPKLVSAIPYTPVTGRRLLYAAGQEAAKIEQRLTSAAIEHAEKLGCSSIHWLFPSSEQHQHLMQHGLLSRMDCQFHWQNLGYRDFENFLSRFTSRKRKNIRKERRHVESEAIRLKVLHGNEMSREEWGHLYQFYRLTFERKQGLPTLSLAFFLELSESMGDQVVVVLAYKEGRCVAGALNYRSANTLYGRHWGCYKEFRSLHFEVCYYQGIEYCITHGLERFEPGAQGEYKASRGFSPTATYSAHWIADPRFRDAIAEFVTHEQSHVQAYIDQMRSHSPYKKPDNP